MDVLQIFALLGGLGVFLYGMRALGVGLEKAAGSRLKMIVERITRSVPRGILVGALVTGLIQSSSATTVIVVGFVNSGVMSLMQAVGVIMGANIGTTITAQILRLGDIQSTAWYLMMFKPSVLAPLLIAVGIMMLMACKRRRYIIIGEILTGFGLLFIGMNMMESSASSIRNLPGVQNAFSQLQNPLLGLLAGALVTAVVQSSSASVGILQATAAAGLVSFSAAVPIVMGQNIGTCVTALLSSIGTKKNAKRAALIHLYFNLIGSIVFIPLIYVANSLWSFPFWNSLATRGTIANFHSLFNISSTLLLFPFARLLVKLADASIPDKQEENELSFLDERFLSTPSVALNEANNEIIMLLNKVGKCLDGLRCRLLDIAEGAPPSIANVLDETREMSNNIATYIGKATEAPLLDVESEQASNMLRILYHINRVQTHIFRVAELNEKMKRGNVELCDASKSELEKFLGLILEAFATAENVCGKKAASPNEKVLPLVSEIRNLEETFSTEHVNRLMQKLYPASSGLLFLEILMHLRRIAEHSDSISSRAAA